MWTHPGSASALTVLMLSAALPGWTSAQRKTPPERGVELLTVAFAAVTRDGHPVTDLKAGEVHVKIGGRTRAVRSLQMIEALAAIEGVPADAGSIPSPFGTNATSDAGRTFVLAIDDDSFRPGRETPLRDAVDLLVRALAPKDRIALVTMPYGGVKVPFTTDHGRVRTAMSRIVGHAPAEETGSAFACRTARTLESLAAFFDTLGVREEPATVIFITAGLAPPRRDAPMTMAPGMCELRAETFVQVGIAAGAARARFYIVQPGDLMRAGGTVARENIAGAGNLGSDNPIEGLEHLAGVTGAKMLNLTGSAETALGRILRETSAHYIATVAPERNDRNGRTQQLEVRVKRAGVDVRTPVHITFARPAPSLGTLPGLSPREMLGTVREFRDLPLRATGFASLNADGETMRVVTVAEPVEPGVKIGTLVAALFDPDGKLVSHWSATSAELERSPVIGAMPAAPGVYRLRVAAIDSTGRSGTADYEVTAEVAKTGPLKLSSIVLGLSRDGTFVPRLQFTTEPVAIGYVEMYGGASGAKVTASLELSSTLNGPPLVTVPLAIQGVGENRYVAKGALPIGAVPPGDYIVRALVGLDGYPMTRVVRTLRKALVAR